MIGARTLLVVVLLAGALTMLVATGAFTTVATERSADVSVVGDSGAVVELVPYESEGRQSQLASLVDGQLQIRINTNSEVDARNVFNVTNQGTQPVAVWITDIDRSEDIAGGTDENNTGAITFYNPEFGGSSSTENGVASVEGRENAVELDVGETLTVSLYIDTSGLETGETDLLDEMVVHADAHVAGSSGTPGGGGSGGGTGPSGDADIHPLPNQRLTLTGPNSERTLRIGNRGSGTLEVTEIRIVGSDADEFAVVAGDAPFTVAPGNGVQPTHSVRIAYTGDGRADARLEIVSNDPDEPVRVVALEGTGGGGSGNGGNGR